jgi:hypothetical protein
MNIFVVECFWIKKRDARGKERVLSQDASENGSIDKSIKYEKYEDK